MPHLVYTHTVRRGRQSRPLTPRHTPAPTPSGSSPRRPGLASAACRRTAGCRTRQPAPRPSRGRACGNAGRGAGPGHRRDRSPILDKSDTRRHAGLSCVGRSVGLEVRWPRAGVRGHVEHTHPLATMWGDMGRYGEIWGDMGRCGGAYILGRPCTLSNCRSARPRPAHKVGRVNELGPEACLHPHEIRDRARLSAACDGGWRGIQGRVLGHEERSASVWRP